MKQRKTVIALVVLLIVCVLGLVACNTNPTPLDAPVITLQDKVVSWQAVEHATSYDVKVGTDSPVNVTSTSYTVTKTAVGDYAITVTAKSSDAKYTTSAPSNTVTYKVEPRQTTTQLLAPEIILEGNVVSWLSVGHATSYDVKINNENAVNVTSTSYTINKTDVGTYTITVVAKSTDPQYTTSIASNPVEYKVSAIALSAPVIVLNGNVVTWQAVDHADKYEVTIGQESPVEVTALTYTVSKDVVGDYAISVVAKSNSANYSASPASNSVTYSVKQLAAPVIVLNGNVVTWQAVQGADKYEVKVDQDAPVEVTALTYTVTKQEVGDHNISVVAKSDAANLLDSAKSNTVTYVVAPASAQKLAAPVIQLDENVVSWQAVEHADKYAVTVGNSDPVEVTALSYTVNETANGSYVITVVAKSNDLEHYSTSDPSNSVTYVVAPKLVSIKIETTNVKDVYYLDEALTQLDLTGLKVIAIYNDDSEQEVDLEDVEIGNYNLTVAGDVEVSIKYQSAPAKTLYVEVKERSIADIDASQITREVVEHAASGKYNTSASVVVNMKGQSILDNGQIALNNGENLIKRDGQFVIIVVAYYINNATDFKNIRNDLNGYYIMTCDIDLENAWQSVIGACPVEDENKYIDLENGENAVGQAGIAFNGTLDGQGYTIANYRIGVNEKYNDNSSRGVAIFGWLGQQGTIKNLTLRNVRMDSGDFTALLVGYNQGTIQNICVEADCHIYSQYKSGAIITAANYGKIENVVSYMTQYNSDNYGGTVWDAPIAIKIDDSVDTSENVVNCYVGDTTNLSETLGGMWRYFDGVGTVLANDYYVYIANPERSVAKGFKYYLNDIFANGDIIDIQLYGAKADQVRVVWDNVNHSHYVEIIDLDATTIVEGDKITVKLCTAKTHHAIEITVTAAVVTQSVAVTQTLSPLEGKDIALASVEIKQTYSDGTEQTINPIELQGYNKNGTPGQAQEVKAYYGEGENDYVTISVTLVAKSVTNITLAEGEYKTEYIIGEDTALDLTGVQIVVSYNNDTSATINVTSDMIDATSYNLAVTSGYNVAISHGGQSCTMPIIVKAANVTVESIAIVGTPAKGTYKIGEQITADDLVGATVTATNSDSSQTTGIAITMAMISYEFAEAGSKQITVTYEGKTATITVTVVDYEETLVVTVANTTIYYSYAQALDLKGIATYKVVMKSGAEKDVDADDITISGDQIAGQHTITYSYVGEQATVTADKQYDIWYDLCVDISETNTQTPAQAWAIINSNLGGYYRMVHDINFEGHSAVIGACPVDSNNNIDTANGTEANGQAGIPFTGKFDGQGYRIKNVTISDGGAHAAVAARGKALFGWVASGASVQNVILSNVRVTGGAKTALLVGLNQGTINNICVEESCYIFSAYTDAGLIAALNKGSISNVVSYMTQYHSNDYSGTDWDVPVAAAGDGTVSETCYVGNNTDLTDALGEGWSYFEGVGTVLANGDYVAITQPSREIPFGGRYYINGIYSNGEAVTISLYGGKAGQMQFGWDGEHGSHYVEFKDLSTTTVVVGDIITVVFRSTNWKSSQSIDITVVAAVVAQAEIVGDDELELVEGLEIDPSSLSIKLTYTDGSETTVTATKTADYDKDGTVDTQQTVKVYYSDEGYVTIKVTPIAKSVESIAIDSTSEHKTNYTIGTDTALDLTGVKIVVSYNNETSETINVTSAMIDSTSYDLTAAGYYNVSVTYQSKSATFGIVVKVAGVTVSSIAIEGTPEKTTYKIDEEVVAADLVGATITATNSDSSQTTGIAITLGKINYDFSEAGSKQITITYEDKTVTITVTVVDYAVSMSVSPVSSSVSYSAATALDLVGAATYTLTMKSGDTVAANAANVSASEVNAGHREVTYTYTDDYATVTATQEFDIWYELGSKKNTKVNGEDVYYMVQDWQYATQHLDGYYRLVADLDLANASISNSNEALRIVPFGLSAYGSDNNGGSSSNQDFAGWSETTAPVPFTGKFDGQGYTIKNASLVKESWDASGFGVALFAYVGEGAVVQNFTLKNITVDSNNQTGIVANTNEGLIQNIVVESDCVVKAYYGTIGVITYNRGAGQVHSVVCYSTTAIKTSNSAALSMEVIKNNYSTQPNSVTNALLVGTAAFESATAASLGEGWKVYAGYGPLYGHHAVLLSHDTEFAINDAFYFDLATDGEISYVLFVKNGKEEYLTIQEISENHYKAILKETTMAEVGQNITLVIKASTVASSIRVTVAVTEAQEGA